MKAIHALKNILFICLFFIVKGLQGRVGGLGVWMAHRLASAGQRMVASCSGYWYGFLTAWTPLRRCRRTPYMWDSGLNEATNRQYSGRDRNACMVTVLSVHQWQNPSYRLDI